MSFSSECNLRINKDKDLEFIQGGREFYQDYYEVVSFCESRTEKPAVDEIMRKTYTKTFNFHDFC